MNVLAKKNYTPFIAGLSFTPNVNQQISRLLPVINPATNQRVAEVLSVSPADVKYAIDKAQDAYDSGVWSRTSKQHRSTVLSQLARSLQSKIDYLAEVESLQTGRAIREMRAQLGRLPEWDYYAALIRTHQDFVAPTQGRLLNYVKRVPLGVIAQITPFNHPLLISVKKIAPALAMGNSVIVKPSELAPISILELAELAIEAGVPPGVLQILPGVGSITGVDLVSNPKIKKVDITAGTQTGRDIGRIVGANLAHYTAELGGKAPVIVFKDADVESAVNGVSFAAFIASGQTCVSGTRLVVHEGIYADFMSQILNKIKSITRRIGNPLNPSCAMGTVISERALSRVVSMVDKRKSGAILVGGSRMTGLSLLDGHDLSQGYFYPPTVVADIDINDELWQEEIFGPVLVVKRFKTEEEAIKLANASKYGLGAAIWTTDLSRAHRVAEEIEAGLVWINCHHRNDPSSPWGGMKESGIGRENGIEALQQYSQSKSVIVNYASTKEILEKEDWFGEGITENRRYG